MNQYPRLIVTFSETKFEERATEVSRSFVVGQSLFKQADLIAYDLLLHLDSQGWTLKFNPVLKLGKELKINFSEYLKKHKAIKESLLVKAITTKSQKSMVVFDATAGLAKDTLFLTFAGLKVHAVEKNKILAFLIKEAQQDFLLGATPWQKKFIEDLKFDQADALELLSDVEKLSNFVGDLPDCIYLDPMFPVQKKTAQVKKEMQMLQYLCSDNTDAELLLTAAIKLKVKQVVVKRMKNSPFLADLKPARQVIGESNRFDLYL